EEFAADVERFVKGEAIAARRSGAMEKGVRWARRRPALVAAAGAALSVALVAGIVLWRSRASAEAENERRGREIAEATERARVAREERERFERKLQELEERLAQAKTDEEKERIRREIEAAKGVEVAGTGVETPKPPDPPAKEKAWAAVEAKVKARMDGHRPGEALKELEAFEASTEEDREWKSEREGRIRTWIEEGLKEIEAAAAAHEAAGDTTAALDAWAPVLEWGVEAGTQRAEQERGRILEVIVASARAEWNRIRLAPLTRTVGDALCAGDFAGAAGEVEKAALEPGADPGAISDLRWITGLATGFREAVFAHAAGQPVETFKYESDGTATVVEVAGESFRIRLPNGAVLPVAWGDVQPSSLADIVRKAGGDEDAIALFWWWWRPPEKLDKDGKMVARNQKRAAEMAVKSPNGARLTAFLEAWRVAGEAAVSPDPGAGPDPAPEGGAAPFAVPAARDPRGGPSRWTYGFGSTTEAADWMVGPRAPPDRFTGWGARIDRKADAEDGVLWLKDGLAGWTGSIARISRIRAQGTLVDAPEGRFGIVLGGFQAWITGGQFLWSAAPSGKSLGGNIDIRKPALNRPVTIELWFEERSINQLHVSVDGERLQSQSVEERLEGPTGVLCEDGSAVQWDWIEIEGVLDSDAESHLREFRSFVAGARYAAGAAKVLSDGKSLGAFKATGEGTWSASGGHLRGKSAGVGPRQEAILRAPGYRNCVLRFRYWAGSARNLMLEARAGAPESALRFVLPSDRAGEWRDVELVLAERCAWCTVDRTLPLFQLNPSGPVGDGELVLALLGGEAAVDDIQVLEIAALEEGSGPAWPWPPAPGPGMGPGPGPGPGPDGWASLWDGQTLEGFAKKEKAAVKNGELWVSGELATDADWPAVEIEMVFALEGTTRFSVGVRKDWLAKIEAGRGKHTLVVRAPRNGKAEVLFDGRPVDSKGGSSDVPGPFRLKVESGTVKIVTLRHRPPP
ncbi:MAG: hypothetical protein IT452_23275, partial [Planctomycetia bacterium]|nr:hypothetical protein [Planctomycetia bacterium]